METPQIVGAGKVMWAPIVQCSIQEMGVEKLYINEYIYGINFIGYQTVQKFQ